MRLRKVYIHPPGGEDPNSVLVDQARRLFWHRGWAVLPVPDACDLAVAPLLFRKLERAEYDRPSFGTLIFHPSLLPRYRGMDSIKHAMAAGDAYTGVTWFWAADGWDTGDICEQELVAIPPGVRPGQLYRDLLIPAALRSLERAAKQLEFGYARRVPQDENAATFYRRYAPPAAQPAKAMAAAAATYASGGLVPNSVTFHAGAYTPQAWAPPNTASAEYGLRLYAGETCAMPKCGRTYEQHANADHSFTQVAADIPR